MSDYVFDDDVQAFIDQTLEFDGNQPENDSVTVQRDNYNRLCQSFAVPYPNGVTSKDLIINSDGYDLALRHYQCQSADKDIAIVYFHGGGFIVGNLESHDSICADICGETKLELFAVDYRLAPEFHFPRDIEDAVIAFEFVSERFSRVIVAGDSAGGTLAAGVCIARQSKTPQSVGQVLIYPALGGDQLNLASYKIHANAPFLTRKSVDYYHEMRQKCEQNLNNPLFAPLLHSDFSGLPPCYAFSADIDPLKDDSEEYCRKLNDSGVEAYWINEIGLVHGYLRSRICTRRGQLAFQRVIEAVRTLAETD